MRKFILIASMVLVSAAAHAGSDRSLTLASSEQPAAAEQHVRDTAHTEEVVRNAVRRKKELMLADMDRFARAHKLVRLRRVQMAGLAGPGQAAGAERQAHGDGETGGAHGAGGQR